MADGRRLLVKKQGGWGGRVAGSEIVWSPLFIPLHPGAIMRVQASTQEATGYIPQVELESKRDTEREHKKKV